MRDERAQRKIRKPPIAFTKYGFQSVRMVGNVGDYWDIRLPEGEIRSFAFFSLFESGGIESVSEADGVWYVADKDHPYSVTTKGEEWPARQAGLTRMFFQENTSRLCVYTVNELSMPSYEPIEFHHLKGPMELVLTKGKIFFLSVGEAYNRSEVVSREGGGDLKALTVIQAEDDLRIFMKPDSYGAVAWKL